MNKGTTLMYGISNKVRFMSYTVQGIYGKADCLCLTCLTQDRLPELHIQCILVYNFDA